MIDLSLISPSTVGTYAACQMRLVWDSLFGKKRGSNSAADFGTVSHFNAMTILGCGPLDPPTEDVIKSASAKFESIDDMCAQSIRCAQLANSKLPVLAPGVKWLAEINVHDSSLLPTRKNRKGETKGFGGNIDLVASDNSHIVDYKFVGELPDYVKVEYVWQMGCYSFLRKAPLTTLLFTTRDALHTTKLTIDWRIQRYAEYLEQMRAFIHRCGMADFERYAYPTAGAHCDYCPHKDRCGASHNAMPVFEFDVAVKMPKPNMNGIDEMRKLLALRNGMAPQTPEQQGLAAVGIYKPEAAPVKTIIDANDPKNQLF